MRIWEPWILEKFLLCEGLAIKCYNEFMSDNDDSVYKDNKIDDKANWLNEHGQPSFKFLQSLVENNNIEKLRSLASDLDVDYSSGSSAEELMGKIISATQ